MHPSFVRGFVKSCYDNGLSEEQAEAALRAWRLREALEDPDFRTGFDKTANTLQELLAKGKDLAGKAVTGFQGLDRTTQGAIAGGAAGVLGGGLFGGRHRFRNALMFGGLGALGGGYLGNRFGGYLGNRSDNTPDLADTMRGAGIPTFDPEAAEKMKNQIAGGGSPFDPNSASGVLDPLAFNKSIEPPESALPRTPTPTGPLLTPKGPTAGALHQFADATTDPRMALEAMAKERALTTDDSGNAGAAFAGAGEGLKNIAAAPGKALAAGAAGAQAVGSAVASGAKAVAKPLVDDIHLARQNALASQQREVQKALDAYRQSGNASDLQYAQRMQKEVDRMRGSK